MRVRVSTSRIGNDNKAKLYRAKRDGGLFPMPYRLLSLIEIGGKNTDSKIFLEADGVVQFIEIM